MIITNEHELDDVAAGCNYGDGGDDDDDDADDDDDEEDDEEDKQNQNHKVRRHALGLPRKKPVCVFISLSSWKHPVSGNLNLPMGFCIMALTANA